MNDTKEIEQLNLPINTLKGIGPKKAQLFSKLGIHTIWDLLYNLPRSYEDRRSIKLISQCVRGQACCICIRPTRQIVERRLKNKLSLFLLYGSDGKDTCTVKWFSAPFSKPKIKIGTRYNVYGVLTSDNGKYEFDMKYIEAADEQRYTGVIVPVYSATAGLSVKSISDTIKLVLDACDKIPDCLPAKIINKYNLMSISEAIKTMHSPTDFESLSKARSRLAFEELFVLSLALSKLKKRRTAGNGIIMSNAFHVRSFAASLPFELTEGQKSAVNDICADMKSGKIMNRLVQGDVGCGKTAVAAAVAYAVAKNGFQTAFMAPTEILASQHFATLSSLFDESVKVALLTSSVRNKKQILSGIASGEYDVVVGTHALIEDNVEFNNLGFCITDEQHRFGVNQRALLGSKGNTPHILVMSATPIPRTLSLIIYGDLDISVIKSMPKGRQPVETYHVNSTMKERIYNFLKKQVDAGRQCYVVCPLVEESEAVDASSVDEITEELSSGLLSGVSVAGVHGRMKPDEKEQIMNSFKNNEINVLVSTTVIEVGVDVPNATVMLIENAERFGLSQLHQLRGRVGRGSEKSYCILLSDSASDNTIERMKIMTETTDGFVVSQKDLELRGCGQFFGTRQHGLPELKVANLFSDIEILKDASFEASEIISTDPELFADELSNVRGRIEKLFEGIDGNDIFN